MIVKNRQLSYLFCRLDVPIRFLYVRTGFVSRLINRLLFWRLYNSDYRKTDKKFHRMLEFIADGNLDFTGKTILELGPGNSYLNAYHLLMRGAKKVILLDKFPRVSETKKQKQLENEELEFVLSQYPFEQRSRLAGANVFREGAIEFVRGDLADFHEFKDIDFIFSTSVLEHVKDVEGNIAAMSRAVRPGGLIYHFIDMRDHYNFSEPFLFYKYSDRVWRKYMTKEGISYTNRVRYGDFMRMFKACGFETIKEETARFPVGRQPVDPCFTGRGDLDVGTLEIFCEKNDL
jgi:SAM-dependent methyltransferase